MDEEVDLFLEHFGVKGMRWGVRKDRAPGVSSRVNREAKKDAAEFARAKAFYGQGAGTRRKLIKQTVEGKEKRIPGYKKAFDHHLDRQDTSVHASKAMSERKRTDRSNRTKKQAGAVARRLTGEMGTQAAFVALIAGGTAYMNSPRGRAMMNKVTNAAKNVNYDLARRQGAKRINDILNNMG